MMPDRSPLNISVTLPDGRAIGVRAWPGQGEPLVLLHGLLDSASGWDDLATASDRPCIAIDLPGFGRSSVPTRPRFSAYAEDVVFAMRSLGVRSATLVGHSLGGGVAAAVAELAPSLVAGIVLSAPAGFGQIKLAELGALPLVRPVAVAALPRLLTNPLLVHAIYRMFVTTVGGPGPSGDLRRRLTDDAHRLGPGLNAALSALSAASRSPRAFHRRGLRYDGPVWVLWGDQDALVPVGHVRGVCAALPQADVHVWPGMGHHPQRERPRELSAFVEAAALSCAREGGVGEPSEPQRVAA
jgi:pimeloyl-ACP methyl ester carboxylesterase